MTEKKRDQPFVSLCTPTFNRRPFIPHLIRCIENQMYPKDCMEWIIIDDGTDPVEDLVKDIPYVKYFKYDKKMKLGEKRNVMHSKCSGGLLVYIDDDDYYPPERVSHAVETLQDNPNAMCCGSSEMHIYFKHLNKMFQFGPYGPTHATAATFAFRRELLDSSRYDDHACLGEEKAFLQDYKVPFAQLDVTKTILVFSHIHNSFDKKKLLETPNKYLSESSKQITDFVKDEEMLHFILNDIDVLLNNYAPGDPANKDDVNMYMKIMDISRKEMMNHMTKQRDELQKQANEKIGMLMKQQESKLVTIVQQLKTEREKSAHLEGSLKSMVAELIDCRKKLSTCTCDI